MRAKYNDDDVHVFLLRGKYYYVLERTKQGGEYITKYSGYMSKIYVHDEIFRKMRLHCFTT